MAKKNETTAAPVPPVADSGWLTETVYLLDMQRGALVSRIDDMARALPDDPQEFFAAFAKVMRVLQLEQETDPARECARRLEMEAQNRLGGIAATGRLLVHKLLDRAKQLLAEGHQDANDALITLDDFGPHVTAWNGQSVGFVRGLKDANHPLRAVTPCLVHGDPAYLLGPAGAPLFRLSVAKAATDRQNERVKLEAEQKRFREEREAEILRERFLASPEGRAIQAAEAQAALLAAQTEAVRQLTEDVKSLKAAAAK